MEKNGVLQDLEETLQHIPVELKKAAGSYKASEAVGANGIHPKVPLDFSKVTCQKIGIHVKSEAMRLLASPSEDALVLIFQRT